MSEIIHLWSRYRTTDADTLRRMALAQASWEAQGWTERPVDDADLPRLFEDGNKRLPYVRDLFDAGCKNLAPDDIVVFSNSDIGMVGEASRQIMVYLQSADTGWCNRKYFTYRMVKFPTNAEVQNAREDAGTDVFFFMAGWWMSNGKYFPDMLLGREAWDPCMRDLMLMTCPNQYLKIDNLCWHEDHRGNGHWMTNRYHKRGQVYNISTAKAFLRSNGMKPSDYDLPC